MELPKKPFLMFLATFLVYPWDSPQAVDNSERLVYPWDSPQAVNYSERPEVREFAASLAATEGLKLTDLLSIFEEAEYQQNIINAISRPAEKTLSWDEYQDIFLTETRIFAGRFFMMQHQKELDLAHQTYGVPPDIIAAVIGVETMYGRHMGNYRVLDALTTLTFDYPPRAEFFRRQLYEYFILVKEENLVITDLKGSYAGAMGYGQFIPSSYRHYAVDFDGDGKRDIWNNPVDAIGSVANYLSEHGWNKGHSIAVQVNAGKVDSTLFNVSLKPSSTLGEFQKLGVDVTGHPDSEISPMKLLGKKGNEYWLGFHNFYVITRYNHSKLYAMAVFQLGEALRRRGSLIGQVELTGSGN